MIVAPDVLSFASHVQDCTADPAPAFSVIVADKDEHCNVVFGGAAVNNAGSLNETLHVPLYEEGIPEFPPHADKPANMNTTEQFRIAGFMLSP
jgi:hypothetical protein